MVTRGLDHSQRRLSIKSASKPLSQAEGVAESRRNLERKVGKGRKRINYRAKTNCSSEDKLLCPTDFPLLSSFKIKSPLEF